MHAALADPSLNLSGVSGRAADAARMRMCFWKTGIRLKKRDFALRCCIRRDIRPGSVCYQHEKTLFCGDIIVLSGIWACGFGGRQLAANGTVAQASAETAGRRDLLSGARHENENRMGAGGKRVKIAVYTPMTAFQNDIGDVCAPVLRRRRSGNRRRNGGRAACPCA